MIVLKIILPAFLLTQMIHGINSLGIRQLNGSQRISVTPVISTVSTRPGVMGASLDVTAGGRADVPNAVSTTTTTTGTTVSTGVTPSTIGNGSINVLRRGTEFVADQIVGALGGIATLATALDNYSQNGEIYLGNLGTSVQALTERLLNLGYNAATTLIQELSTQATSTPMWRRFNIRPARFFASSTGPVNGRAFLLNTMQTQPQQNFGFVSRISNNGNDEASTPVRAGFGGMTMGMGDTGFSTPIQAGVDGTTIGVGGTGLPTSQARVDGATMRFGGADFSTPMQARVDGTTMGVGGTGFGSADFSTPMQARVDGTTTGVGGTGFGSADFSTPMQARVDGTTTGVGGTGFSAKNLTAFIQSAMRPFISPPTSRISSGIQTSGQSSLSAGVSPSSSVGIDTTPASSVRVDTTSSISSSATSDSSERP